MSFAAFMALLWTAGAPWSRHLPVDAYLKLDPILVLGSSLSARQWVPAGTIVVLLAATLVVGRFFCGMLCPLGATIDASDRVLLGKGHLRAKNVPPSDASGRMRRYKYRMLLFLGGASLVGISFVFLVAPLSIVTRFYALLVYPVICLLGNAGLDLFRPIADTWDWPTLSYAEMGQPRFDSLWFTVLLTAGLLAGAAWSPRFWCRYLCPSGAILAICGVRPLWRRTVSADCVQCGLCRRLCPMNAIDEDPFHTRHTECIVCQTCVQVCPTGAVCFAGPSLAPVLDQSLRASPHPVTFSAERRRLLVAGTAGLAAGAVTLSGLNSLHGSQGPGTVKSMNLVRPPGALPESDFLALCVRCGECMNACPTNALQPMGTSAGASAFFSPVLTPRRGPCETTCNACGLVCPTGAIRPLELSERRWAKMGTAYILPHKCLIWEFGRHCLICDEACPYDALQFRRLPERTIPVPVIDENRCSGCGACVFHCPVQATAAIVVEPMGAIRLKNGSYAATARRMGLTLEVKPQSPGGYPGYSAGLPDRTVEKTESVRK